MRVLSVIAFILSSSVMLLQTAHSQGATPPKLLEGNVFYSSGNLRIRAFTVRPTIAGRLPAIILNHGGTDGIGDSTKARARDLARLGFAVFASAYRGEDGSDGKIEIAAGEVDDVLNGMTWWSQQRFVDPNRIGMLGSSHGALIGLLSAARSSRIRALVFAYGVSDIYAWYRYLVASKQLGQDALTRTTYGNGPEDKPENFLLRYGMRVVPQLPAAMPVLILQGAKDTTVPLEQGQLLAAELQKYAKPHTLEVYPNSGHGFLTAREAVLKKYGAKSVQYTESLKAWSSALAFLKQNLERR
jgi:dipeptidyl aminopeptidase/acylaminoacyl peptidase